MIPALNASVSLNQYFIFALTKSYYIQISLMLHSLPGHICTFKQVEHCGYLHVYFVLVRVLLLVTT